MDVLVVILDGMSYVFANTFCWWRTHLERLWHMPGAKRSMMYVDTIPQTPVVAQQFFRINIYTGLGLAASIAEWVWQLAKDKRTVVVNIPVKAPPVYYGVQRPPGWIDYFVLPPDNLDATVLKFHNNVKHWLRGADIGVVWYMVPDQAHHSRFPTIHDYESLSKALDYYDLAAKLALDLLCTFKPRRWLVVSDHGFTSDAPEYPIQLHIHLRDAVAITNYGEPPRRSSEVLTWMLRAMGA